MGDGVAAAEIAHYDVSLGGASGERCSHGAASPCGTGEDASTQRGGYSAGGDFSVLTWLNLVCMDAPLVAISWQWLFARSFGIPIAPGGTAALFLIAWLIYLADRFGDSLSVNERGPLSLRQRFCWRHRAVWIFGIIGIALADIVIISVKLDHGTVRAGAIVGMVAVVYLVLNRRSPSLWRMLPLKEVSIGFLFAAGTMVGLAAGLTSAALPGWLLFACLCLLNCVSIAVWERELDLAQARISIATVFPCVRRALGPMLGILLIAGGVLAGVAPDGRTVFECIAASAALLVIVHYFSDAIEPDARTALADFVLLTPLVALLS